MEIKSPEDFFKRVKPYKIIRHNKTGHLYKFKGDHPPKDFTIVLDRFTILQERSQWVKNLPIFTER